MEGHFSVGERIQAVTVRCHLGPELEHLFRELAPDSDSIAKLERAIVTASDSSVSDCRSAADSGSSEAFCLTISVAIQASSTF